MNILLTNDDGCDAPGLYAAFEALSPYGCLHVVAPRTERSACSHTITLGRPITVERIQHEKIGTMFAVDGTPADCVRLAVARLVQGPIHLAVSGINAGANAGVDVYYSGTVAGAREAALLGIPAIAFSQALRNQVEIDWAAARDATVWVTQELLNERLPGPGFWNVNLPAPIPRSLRNHVHRVPTATHPVPLTFDQVGQNNARMEFRYGASYWLRDATGPSDYCIIRDGGIAITAVPLFGEFRTHTPGAGPRSLPSIGQDSKTAGT